MNDTEEAREYLSGIIRTRGYAHPSHRLLAAHDLRTLRAINEVTLANYIPMRLLDEIQKELVLIVTFCALRASENIIRAHVEKAEAAGANPMVTLAAILMVLPEGGRIVVEAGLNAWKGVKNRPAGATSDHSTKASDIKSATESRSMDIETILKEADPPVAEAAGQLERACYEAASTISSASREMIMLAALVCLRAPHDRLCAQVRRALESEASARQILETLELLITPAGLPIFELGLRAWAEVTDAKPVDPAC